MAEVGGMIASAMLSVVFKQISTIIGGQITLQQDFTQDLLKMKMTLESVSAVLKDAERKSVESCSVQLWLKRLKKAMYDISDMLDEFEADTQQPSKFKNCLLQLASIGPKNKLANRMKKMREELEEITDQHSRFSLEVGSASNEHILHDARETTVVMNDEEVRVGRTEEERKVMDCLSRSITEKLTIFPIYGNGGIGKTTMANTVFNDRMFNEYSRVWIYVSQTFDMKRIGNSIISQLSKMESQITEMQMIHTRLVELFAGKNILIVLDDLWEDNNQFQLDELKKMLKVSEDSKVVVIVTTRNESTANDLRTIQPYKLPLLSEDSCWTIIKLKSGIDSRADDKKLLEHIGKDIARKCGGVALAAKVLGHMLRNFTSDEWESVSKNSIWNPSTSEETHHVLSSLRLTYSYMPSHLRLCFAYCAIFPKGQEMVKDDLIHQWISLGFIDTTHVLNTSQLGEKYIKQLLELSFLEHSAARLHHDDVTHLTMHDLVHDLARLVLADELVLRVSKVDNINTEGSSKLGNINTMGSSCRYALLDDCSKKLELYTDSPAKIRALRFLNCGETGLHNNAFSCGKYLRVLDLSHCFIQKLPNSVGQLKQLRYLNAPKIQHQMIPNSITKLLKLMYLSLHGSSALLKLPDSIGDLKGLIYLDLSGCSGLKELPKSFGKLKKLVHLDLSNCSDVAGDSEFLQSLTDLEYLNLTCCLSTGVLPEHLGGLLKLKYLNLSCSEYFCRPSEGIPEALGSLTKLQYLNLSRCSFIDGTKMTAAMGGLTELRHLYLSGFLDTSRLEKHVSTFIECIGNLSNLEYVDLSHNCCLRGVPDCFGCLGKLRVLDLSYCQNLMWVSISVAQIGGLQMVDMNGCDLMVKDFWHNGKTANKSLITLPEFKVQADHGASSSNIALLQGVNPNELQIIGLEKVKSIEELESIRLVGKERIKKLRFEWSRGSMERAVEDNVVLGGLVPPSTIESLHIRGYNSAMLPGWLMGIPAYNFPNLVKIYLEGLDNCISLPPLGQLPDLAELVLKAMRSIAKIDEDLCGGAVAFPRLKYFTLNDMPSLQVWNTMCSSGYMFPSLRYLKIHGCPKLRLKPCPPKAERWTIVESDGVISSWEESTSDTGASTSSSPLVTKLTIKRCKLPMHQWRLLHHLPTLHELCIQDCSDLTSSPEIPRALSTLKYLLVDSCDLAPLPEWLGHLTSLEKLELRYPLLSSWGESMSSDDGASTSTSPRVTILKIEGCKVPMHEWGLIHHLPALRDLYIYSCSDLTSSPEIAGALSTLKYLSVDSCDLAPLPEWLRHLTSLEKLVLQNSKVEALQLQEVAKHLTSLQTLFLKDCDSMIALPQWVGDLTSIQWLIMENCPNLNNLQEIKGCLTSLEILSIFSCPGLESLPESIQQSTKLKDLRIEGCPALRRWCETEENRRKLSHIKEVHI